MVRAWAACVAAIVGLQGALAAQDRDWSADRVEATRQQLQETLARFESAARSRAYSPELRARASEEAAVVRARLEDGDFRVGERVLISVEREPELSDTFVVSPDVTIRLPNVGTVDLKGVLRSELEEYVTERISRFVNDPVVETHSFLRIAVSGQVGRPGVHLVPADMPLSEALMFIGGPGPEANVSKIRVERAGERIWEGDALQEVLGQGLTLAELGMRSGDRIVVPGRSAFAVGEIARSIALLSGLVFALSRIF
jgi:polysaccharide export outer membrane protein